MKSAAQPLSVIAATALSYVWLSVPEFQRYSLQLTAVLFLTYVVIKWMSGSKLHHFAPNASTLELTIFTIALLVLVGYTGGLDSILLPLLYLLMFIGVFIFRSTTLIVLEFMLPLYLWGISGTSFLQLDTPHLATLLSFPILLPLLLFARSQYLQATEQKVELEVESNRGHETTLFLTTFLKPKLRTLLDMSEYPEHNKEALQRQITVIIEETELVTQPDEEE